jgi:hypothetical protein
VNGVGIVRYLDVVPGQLLAESYRPRTGGPRRVAEFREPLPELLGPADERLPEPGARLVVEGDEELAAAGVLHHQPGSRPLDAARDRVQRADAGRRQIEAGGEAAGGGDPDPQAGEGAGAETDGDQDDPLPAAGRRGYPLDLGQQRGRVPGAALRGDPQQRLLDRLAAAPGADGGVGGRGIEADDDQGGAASSS